MYKKTRSEKGGSAFPIFFPEHDGALGQVDAFFDKGMTLRDYFAAKAMNCYIEDALRNRVVDCQEVASFAYEMADVMLKERNREEG